ncbi:hypothetical protein K492DRAFT_170376 [Lichtheimia hyalospora FSU 10163]|nr:hypothetical protein K492DRAFT_170376 [Lichtheimia hyalospora FSU 10163]
MQSTLESNRVSNWTVALMLGASAALRSGSQNGIVGELPICDVVLTLDKRVPKGDSGENVFYGRDTHWARMVLKSFHSRRLEFSHVLLKEDMKCPHELCMEYGCLMAPDPLEEKRKKKQANKEKQENKKKPSNSSSSSSSSNSGNLITPTNPINSTNPTDRINSSSTTAYGTETLRPNDDDGDLSEMRTPPPQVAIDMKNEYFDNDPPENPKPKIEVGTMADPTGSDSASIQPNMLYGLSKDYYGENNIYKVVHREKCIKKMPIDERAIEFLNPNLRENLRGKTYESAKDLCKAIIDQMCDKVKACDTPEVNTWDKRIIRRVQRLMIQYPHLPKGEPDSVWNETMDRIHSRIPDMLERLKITEFTVVTDGKDVDYSVKDLSGAFLVFFGIQRAKAMSRSLYDDDSLIFMGYNASTGHDVIRDLTEVPSQAVDGFSKRLLIESSSKVRVIEKDIETNHLFILAVILDTAISVAIMLLTFIGPILSMYGARLWTSSYRETYMKMGTTMRWSVSQVSMMHSGQARDDWMVCIKPMPKLQRNFQILGFLAFSFISSVTAICLWPFFHPKLVFPFSTFSVYIFSISCGVGVPWVILAQAVYKDKKSDDDGDDAEKKDNGYFSKIWNIRSVHSIINIGFVLLLIIFAGIGVEHTWLYLYVLEAVYTLQWLYGELMDEWVYESTALFMLGALSALRLTNLPK